MNLSVAPRTVGMRTALNVTAKRNSEAVLFQLP